MKTVIIVAIFIWLVCGLAGGWRLGNFHWKTIAKGPITLAKAFEEKPVSYPGP